MEKCYIEVYFRGKNYKVSLYDIKRVHEIKKTKSYLPTIPLYEEKSQTYI